MKPFVILLAVFTGSLLFPGLVWNSWNYKLAGNIAMSAMLLFTAIGHFAFGKGMEMMLPAFIPFKRLTVVLTGVIEIAAAIGLLIPACQSFTALLLIVFFVLVLPANIYAAYNKVNYQEGAFNGPGKTYLWFRILLQLLFIGWVYACNLI